MEAVLICAYFNFLFGQNGCDLLKKWGSDLTGDDHSLNRITRSRALRLRVNDYSHRHIEIGFAVHIGDAESKVMFDYRHSRMTNDRFDQGPASPRNNQIDVLIHLGHVPHGIATSFRNEQDTVFGQACAGYAGTERL